eukprot:COSAG05_NODE_76_length_21413_cov_40.065122_3_plen_145_part_00
MWSGWKDRADSGSDSSHRSCSRTQFNHTGVCDRREEMDAGAYRAAWLSGLQSTTMSGSPMAKEAACPGISEAHAQFQLPLYQDSRLMKQWSVTHQSQGSLESRDRLHMRRLPLGLPAGRLDQACRLPVQVLVARSCSMGSSGCP